MASCGPHRSGVRGAHASTQNLLGFLQEAVFLWQSYFGMAEHPPQPTRYRKHLQISSDSASTAVRSRPLHCRRRGDPGHPTGALAMPGFAAAVLPPLGHTVGVRETRPIRHAAAPIGEAQRRRGFHGPTPPRRSGLILVMYPGGGSGIPGKMTSGPR